MLKDDAIAIVIYSSGSYKTRQYSFSNDGQDSLSDWWWWSENDETAFEWRRIWWWRDWSKDDQRTVKSKLNKKIMTTNFFAGLAAELHKCTIAL